MYRVFLQTRPSNVIMRLWHGYTKPDDGDNYERMLKDEILPGEFAGTDQTKSVIHPKAHALLTYGAIQGALDALNLGVALVIRDDPVGSNGVDLHDVESKSGDGIDLGAAVARDDILLLLRGQP